MTAILRFLRAPVAILLVLSMPGCTSLDPGALTSLPGDLMAMPGNVRNLASRPTSAGDVMSKVGSAMAIIATVQRYAALTNAQKSRVQHVVSRKYDGMVEREKRVLAPRYADRKADARKRGAAKVAEARQKSPTAVAKAEAETKREVERVDIEWEKAAKTSVAKNYGTDFAVPVSNPDGKAVVAFASVRDSGVNVSDSSYEVASTAGSLGSKKVSHAGRNYVVLDEKVGP